jgi:TonB family protein
MNDLSLPRIWSRARDARGEKVRRQVQVMLRVCLALMVPLVFLVRGIAQEKSLQVSEPELRKAAIYKPEPEYPAVARQIRMVGEVELLVNVDPNGQVDKVTVTRGNTLLAGPCTQAMKKWKFTPFHADGQAVHAVGPVKFNFQM